MSRLKLRERLTDPRAPGRPRRAAYALPTLFTAGNIFLGFYALVEVFQGAMQVAQGATGMNLHFQAASIAIGVAVFLDGLDGRIARMTNTVSDFGRELDSLADLIAFGIAPAALSFAWGIRFVDLPADSLGMEYLQRAGYFLSFIYLLCGAARLARFNIQSAPTVPSDHKNFVGLPIPAGAGLIAAIVHFNDGIPIGDWLWVPFWLVVILGTSLLMVSTWRYSSFKDVDLRRKRRFAVVIGVAGAVALIWYYSQVVLLLIASVYVLSGILTRLANALRRSRIEPQPKEHSA